MITYMFQPRGGRFRAFRFGEAIPLAMLPEGCRATVAALMGGRGLVRRLSEIGFTPGVEVVLLKSGSPGPVLVGVRGSRVALGRGVAMRVLVYPRGG